MSSNYEKITKNILKRKISWTEAILVNFLITGSIAMGASLTSIQPGDTVDLISKDGTIGWENGIYVTGTANLTGDTIFNISTVSGNNKYEPTGIDVSRIGKVLGEHSLTVNISPNENGKNIYPAGARVTSGGKIEVKDLNIKVVDELEVERIDGVDNAAYGIQIGTAINWADAAKNETSKVLVENANIEVTNTENSRRAGWYRNTFLGEIKVFDVYHQLTGIRVIRTDNSSSSTPYYESTGKTIINVHDSSTAGNVANYNVGIYVSGEDSKVVLNDSEIKISGKGTVRNGSEQYGSNSSALKIGKARQTGKGAGIIESKGNMVIDTKDSPYAPAVRLLGDGSTLKADFENSSAKIESAGNVILYGIEDFRFVGGFGGVAAGENGKNQTVLLKDAKLNTTSDTASLIKVETKRISELGNAYYSDYRKYNNNFHVENATFNLKGSESLATAADNGWLIEVQGQRNNSSSLTANIEEKANIVGLTHKEHRSSLTMNIDDAKWELKKKGDITTSTANEINLKNGAILDVSSFTDDTKAEYTIKLTSDGTTSDGTLTNAGTINLVNNSYEDILTIDGNYVGQDGKIKMNTEWNSPGDELGGNSKSDLIHIKGTASGTTTILPVKIDGTENVLDGSIGDIASDLEKRTVPVITVDDSTNYSPKFFIGKAKTTGAGEIQLSENKKDDGTIEYFWTLTALNSKDPNQPIFSQPTSSYVQMPKANMDLAYDSLRTLHERKGENETLNWEEFKKHQKVPEDQIWVRTLGSKSFNYGKDRFNMERKNKGVQLGKEFSIKRDDDGKYILKGGYLTYQESKISFEDKYRAENAIVVADKYTGSGKTKALSLGLTRTSYSEEGEYLDLVGQLTLLNNKYYSRDNISAKNKAWGLTLSAEYGKPYEFKKNRENNTSWLFEPQAQLIYQYMSFNSFNDDYRNIKQKNQNNIRGRLGFRLAYNDYEVKERKGIATWYGVGNIWHTFSESYETKIGKDNVSEKYAKTLGELGIGIQIPVGEKSYLYADFRYARAFSRIKHKEYRGTIGLRYTF